MKARRLIQAVLALALLGGAASDAQAVLPEGFQFEDNYLLFSPMYDPPGVWTFRHGVIDMGPDGNLWTFRPQCEDSDGGIGDPGIVQTMDPVDGLFFNWDDIRSEPFGHEETFNSVLFTHEGKLLQGKLDRERHGEVWLLRDPVDGIFFNGNDTVQELPWIMGGIPAYCQWFDLALGPDGKIYSHDYYYVDTPGDGGYYVEQVIVFDPVDGDLASDTYSITVFDLPDVFRSGGANNGPVAFDHDGNLYMSGGHYELVGIDPVDGIFFNGNDILRVYNWAENGLPDGFSPKGSMLITDITFDHNNHIIVADGGREMLHRLSPVYGPQEPPVVNRDDFNVDASPDLLWRNQVSGKNYVWFMDGATVTSGASLPDVGDTGWQLK